LTQENLKKFQKFSKFFQKSCVPYKQTNKQISFDSRKFKKISKIFKIFSKIMRSLQINKQTNFI